MNNYGYSERLRPVSLRWRCSLLTRRCGRRTSGTSRSFRWTVKDTSMDISSKFTMDTCVPQRFIGNREMIEGPGHADHNACGGERDGEQMIRERQMFHSGRARHTEYQSPRRVSSEAIDSNLFLSLHARRRERSERVPDAQGAGSSHDERGFTRARAGGKNKTQPWGCTTLPKRSAPLNEPDGHLNVDKLWSH